MTPQEIFDYKNKWLRENCYPVRIHSDLRSSASDWCKENLEKWQWKYVTYTNIYEDTVYFELEEHSTQLIKQFPDYCNQ